MGRIKWKKNGDCVVDCGDSWFRERGVLFSGISIGRWNYIRVCIVFSVKGWGYEGDFAVRASMFEGPAL